MNAVESAQRERLSGYRILACAIVFSLAWHLFWIFVVKVVAPLPANASQVKFSRVSFIGRIFAKVNMEVRSQPAERSLLEKRYNDVAAALDKRSRMKAHPSGAAVLPDSVHADTDNVLSFLISDAVSQTKAEPDYGAD